VNFEWQGILGVARNGNAVMDVLSEKSNVIENHCKKLTLHRPCDVGVELKISESAPHHFFNFTPVS